MKQFECGFVLDGLTDLFKDDEARSDHVGKLCRALSNFCVEGLPDAPAKISENPYVSVLKNILQRGIPSRLGIHSLRALAERTAKIQLVQDEVISVDWHLFPQDLDTIWRCLHIIDPRLSINSLSPHQSGSWENQGSEFERKFLLESIPKAFSPGLVQLLCPQRSIDSIIKGRFKPHTPDHIRRNFMEQRTDFSIEVPYKKDIDKAGIVIEIDGIQHSESAQKYLDTERDAAVAYAGWHNTLRILTDDFPAGRVNGKLQERLSTLIASEYIQTCLTNYSNSLLLKHGSRELLEITLIPFAIARLQLTLLESISSGQLTLQKQNVRIAVIERDVPCASLGLKELRQYFESLKTLSDEAPDFPEIKLEVFTTDEFADSKYQLHDTASKVSMFDEADRYDLVLDISVLQRFGSMPAIRSVAPVVQISSAHFPQETRLVHTNRLIRYNAVCKKDRDEKWLEDGTKKEALKTFLHTIFRKTDFRPGQLPIISKALQCRSVIGLLPTGGGKSLTYQLSAFLQPGVCIVIAPIRSLMKDQVDGLNDNQVDSAVFINSTLKGDEKRKAIQTMSQGKVQFTLVSPERLQMEEFRSELGKMYDNDVYFSYCVIDEVHCVSEWGHDFRTSYLRLGENAIAHCKTANLPKIPLIGLTATASYDVLADVQRELSGRDDANRLDEDALVRFESTIRPELQFIIEDIKIPTQGLKNMWDVRRTLGQKKKQRMAEIIKTVFNAIDEYVRDETKFLPDGLLTDDDRVELVDRITKRNYNNSDFYQKNGGLIFCPHKSGPYGVTDKFKRQSPWSRGPSGIYDELERIAGLSTGFFMGSGDENDENSEMIATQSMNNQTLFKSGKQNLMVATKAFGMGIDKSNIRYSIHTNYPGSLESFVQEAGRCGRDRALALSYILFNDQTINIPDREEPFDHDLDINLYFHNNSFKGLAKEMAVLDELLTEIYFPDRSFELENIVSEVLDCEVKLIYWEGGHNKRLYVNQGFDVPLGYIDLNQLAGATDKSLDPTLSAQIFATVIEYIKSLRLSIPISEWIQTSEKSIGIEQLLERKEIGETFSIVIGFQNNTKERVKTITQWLQQVIDHRFDETWVKKTRANCNEADQFIEEVATRFYELHKTTLDFGDVCARRDASKGKPRGYAHAMFMSLFNGYREKADTEKAIYRLCTAGIVEDYTVNFAGKTFTLYGRKKTLDEYRDDARHYLLKFYGEQTAKNRLADIDDVTEGTYLRKLLYFIVQFVYDQIKKKRAFAITTMKAACREALDKGDKGNLFLREYIDLYFNSKYARRDYRFTNSITGEEVEASLTDLTKEGKLASLDLVWEFIEFVDIDPSATPIENIKHMRGACVRMITNSPDNYTFRFLNAYALYSLEYKNKRLVQEAEAHLIQAFLLLEDENPDYSDNELESIFNMFKEKLLDHNDTLLSHLNAFGMDLQIDSIMLPRYLKKLKNINSNIKGLNKTLLPYGK